MAEPIRIVIQWDISKTSHNQRLHWRERHKRWNAAKVAGYLGWLKAGSPTLRVPVKVSLISRRGRALDAANVADGSKACLDGALVGALLPDDSPRWVREVHVLEQQTGKQWKGREELELVIEPLEEDRAGAVGVEA